MRRPARPHSILGAPLPRAFIGPVVYRVRDDHQAPLPTPEEPHSCWTGVFTGGFVQGEVHVRTWARLKSRGAPADRGRSEGARRAGTNPAALKGESRGRDSTTMVGLPRPAFDAHPDPVVIANVLMGITSIAHYLGYPCDRYHRRGYGGWERAATSCAREKQQHLRSSAVSKACCCSCSRLDTPGHPGAGRRRRACRSPTK